MAWTNTVFVTLEHEECCSCHIVFGITPEYRRQKLNNRTVFHCPNGHPQHYLEESREVKLERQFREQQAMRWEAEKQRDKAIRSKDRLKKRIEAGVCIHCHRSFENLRRHMAGQHKGVKG